MFIIPMSPILHVSRLLLVEEGHTFSLTPIPELVALRFGGMFAAIRTRRYNVDLCLLRRPMINNQIEIYCLQNIHIWKTARYCQVKYCTTSML